MLRRRVLMETLKSMELQRHKLVDQPREMNLSEILTEYPIPLEHDSCLVILSYHGENVATHGTQTRPILLFWVVNNQAKDQLSARIDSLVSAEEARNQNSFIWGVSNGSYWKVSDGKITSSLSTSKTYYYAAGNSLYYTAIPYDYTLGDYIS